MNWFAEAKDNPDLVLLEGFHALKHALRFPGEILAAVSCNVEKLAALSTEFTPDLQGQMNDVVEIVTQERFRELVPHAPHTEVAAIARKPRYNIEKLIVGEPLERPAVLLEDPRNLGNLGAVIRLSAAANAAGVITTGINDPWAPLALRGSAGLHFALPVGHIDEIPSVHRNLVAFDPEGEEFDPSTMPANSILAFGTERHGLTDELLGKADTIVRLPMRPGVSSLNLATSVAAVLYAWHYAKK